MVAFAVCLFCAGAVLSVIARVPALLVVLGAVILATLVAGGLALAGLGGSRPVLANVVVATVALQAGYGAGVILRAALHMLQASHQAARAMRGPPEAPHPSPERSGAPHPGRPAPE
ncbi:hypothetical protein OPKNFCMD_6280 [Methylobacterium crusticola]|uniref:Uncharacterized protein n=1 Tax=Methylobacterium crusticola TaxID=1697972 RepID=A0ABQ4R8G6_9HYPH|nr:hypothetical protein [Methylobacterium crusticola]GJD53504.1 hypothetical protein OPKNFCMD_6280 [Methylobacterium crusticola]